MACAKLWPDLIIIFHVGDKNTFTRFIFWVPNWLVQWVAGATFQPVRSSRGSAESRTAVHNSHPYFFNLCSIYFRKHKVIIIFSIIFQHWHATGSWNLSSGQTRTRLSHIVNTMAADGSVIQRTQESAAIVLTVFTECSCFISNRVHGL